MDWSSYITRFILVTVPFFSLPFLPGSYASLTPYLSGVFGLYALKYLKIRKVHTVYYGVMLYVFAHYSMLGLFYNPSAIIGVVGYIIAFLSFTFFSRFPLKKDVSMIAMVLKSSWVVTFFVLFDLITKLLSLDGVRIFGQSLIAGVSTGRVVITTSEPAWASVVLLFYLIFFTYNYIKQRSFLTLAVGVIYLIAFIMSFSLFGFVVLLITILFYLLIFKINFKTIFKAVTVFILIFFLFSVSYTYFAPEGSYVANRIVKVIALLRNVYSIDMQTILLIDESVLVRLGYPLMAFHLFKDYPLGLGIGAFGANIQDYLYLLPEHGMRSQELINQASSGMAEPRNLFLRIITDFGIVGGILFITFIKFLVRKLRFFENSEVFLLRVLLCFALAVSLQFSTPYFIIFPLIFGLICRFIRKNS